jgi:hypothetical protein
MRTLGFALAVVLFWAGGAQARREQSYPYQFSRVWTAAVRLVRVDFESTITEKDRDSGYFLFGFVDGAKSHPGSVEIVPVKNGAIESVRVIIQVPAMPSYVEQMLLDRLARKLSQDYGAPPAPKSETPTTGAAPAQPQSPAAEGDGPRNSGEKPAETKTDRPKAEAPPAK